MPKGAATLDGEWKAAEKAARRRFPQVVGKMAALHAAAPRHGQVLQLVHEMYPSPVADYLSFLPLGENCGTYFLFPF